MRFGSRKSFFGSSKITFDPDAESYFLAAGITNRQEQIAVNNLILKLKDSSFWDRFERLFLISRTSSEASLICCRTLTLMTNVNSVAWSSNGFNPNYTDNYLDTNFAFTEIGSFSNYINCSGGVWVSNTAEIDSSTTAFLFGAQSSVDFTVQAESNATQRRFECVGPSSPSMASSAFETTLEFSGHISGYLFSQELREIFLNGVSIGINIGFSFLPDPLPASGVNVFLGANNLFGAPEYGSMIVPPVFTLLWLAEAFNSVDMLNLHNIFLEYQQALGRE